MKTTSRSAKTLSFLAVLLGASLVPATAHAVPTPAQRASTGLSWFSWYLTTGQIYGGEGFGRWVADKGLVWHDADTTEMLADYTFATGDTTYLSNLTAYQDFNGIYIFGSNSPGFGENSYNDDKLWWALAMIRIYDVLQVQRLGDSALQQKFLSNAETIFQNVSTSWGHAGVCGGGLTQTTDGNYLNAITNELFFQTATALMERDPYHVAVTGWIPTVTGPGYSRSYPDTYLGWAVAEWEWFKKYWWPVDPSENWKYEWPPNADGGDALPVVDALDNGTCAPAPIGTGPGAFWTYNDGPILGALLDLAWTRASGSDDGLIPDDPATLAHFAYLIAQTTMDTMSESGILTEDPDDGTANGCTSGDCMDFKGVFMRYLGRLLAGVYPSAAAQPAFVAQATKFLDINEAALEDHWTAMAGDPPSYGFPEKWQTTNTNILTTLPQYQASQTSALDAIIADIRAPAPPPPPPPPPPPCTPKTFADVCGVNATGCGSAPDGCGGVITCTAACASPLTCQYNVCSMPQVCPICPTGEACQITGDIGICVAVHRCQLGYIFCGNACVAGNVCPVK